MFRSPLFVGSSRAAAPLLTAVLAGSLAMTGCAKDPSKDVPSAQVEAAKPAAEPAAAEPAAAEPAAAAVAAAPAADPAAAAPAADPAAAPAADPAAAAPAAEGIALTGDVLFTGSKVTGSHDCKFAEWSGSFRLAEGKAEGGALKFEIKTASAIADYKEPNDWSKKLEEHFRSAEFFDVVNHPTANFESTEIKAGGENGATHTVSGKLTIRGTTKDVTFPATITVEGGKVQAKTQFSINRKDFGVQYPGKPDDLIREGVVLSIDVRG